MPTHGHFAGHLAGLAAIALALVAAGCATSEPATATAPATPADTPSSPAPSPQLIASGDEVFHNSSCLVCHGEDAKGTAVGPDLTDATWLSGDGSVGSITTIISAGVDAPKQFRSPMPAMGGANLSDDDLNAVAAYVWSLSHK